MLLFAYLVERYILKHLVNQEPIILFMATIGLAYFMEGFGDLMWGSNIKTLDVGIPQGGNFWIEGRRPFLLVTIFTGSISILWISMPV